MSACSAFLLNQYGRRCGRRAKFHMRHPRSGREELLCGVHVKRYWGAPPEFIVTPLTDEKEPWT
jgi:hypothetical protein